jgi:hypothetical protein
MPDEALLAHAGDHGMTRALFQEALTIESLYQRLLQQEKYDLLSSRCDAAAQRKDHQTEMELKMELLALEFKPDQATRVSRGDLNARAEKLEEDVHEHMHSLTDDPDIKTVKSCEKGVDRISRILQLVRTPKTPKSPSPKPLPLSRSASKNSFAKTLELLGRKVIFTGQHVLMDVHYASAGVNQMKVKAKLWLNKVTLRAEYERLRVLNRTVRQTIY